MQEDEKIEEYAIYDDQKGQGKESWWKKLGGFLNDKYFVPIVIILIATIAFALGRISGLQEKREPVRVISGNSPQGEVKGESIKGETGENNPANIVVASKNGTKYHYPWCAGAKQISEKNKITFNSIEEARAQGYTPASNCKGLK